MVSIDMSCNEYKIKNHNSHCKWASNILCGKIISIYTEETSILYLKKTFFTDILNNNNKIIKIRFQDNNELVCLYKHNESTDIEYKFIILPDQINGIYLKMENRPTITHTIKKKKNKSDGYLWEIYTISNNFNKLNSNDINIRYFIYSNVKYGYNLINKKYFNNIFIKKRENKYNEYFDIYFKSLIDITSTIDMSFNIIIDDIIDMSNNISVGNMNTYLNIIDKDIGITNINCLTDNEYSFTINVPGITVLDKFGNSNIIFNYDTLNDKIDITNYDWNIGGNPIINTNWSNIKHYWDFRQNLLEIPDSIDGVLYAAITPISSSISFSDISGAVLPDWSTGETKGIIFSDGGGDNKITFGKVPYSIEMYFNIDGGGDNYLTWTKRLFGIIHQNKNWNDPSGGTGMTATQSRIYVPYGLNDYFDFYYDSTTTPWLFSPLGTNNNHHFVFTLDEFGNYNIYHNNIKYANGTNTNFIGNLDILDRELYIGFDPSHGGEDNHYLQGQYKYFRIWDIALDETLIGELYSNRDQIMVDQSGNINNFNNLNILKEHVHKKIYVDISYNDINRKTEISDKIVSNEDYTSNIINIDNYEYYKIYLIGAHSQMIPVENYKIYGVFIHNDYSNNIVTPLSDLSYNWYIDDELHTEHLSYYTIISGDENIYLDISYNGNGYSSSTINVKDNNIPNIFIQGIPKIGEELMVNTYNFGNKCKFVYKWYDMDLSYNDICGNIIDANNDSFIIPNYLDNSNIIDDNIIKTQWGQIGDGIQIIQLSLNSIRDFFIDYANNAEISLSESTGENCTRIVDSSFNNISVRVMDISGTDTSSNIDGGFQITYNASTQKNYIYITFIKRTSIGGDNSCWYYNGPIQPSWTNIPIIESYKQDVSGTNVFVSNPYFSTININPDMPLNKWCMTVGIIYKYSDINIQTYIPRLDVIGTFEMDEINDLSFNKLNEYNPLNNSTHNNSYKFTWPFTNKIGVRMFKYYDSNANLPTNLQIYKPSIIEVDDSFITHISNNTLNVGLKNIKELVIPGDKNPKYYIKSSVNQSTKYINSHFDLSGNFKVGGTITVMPTVQNKPPYEIIMDISGINSINNKVEIYNKIESDDITFKTSKKIGYINNINEYDSFFIENIQNNTIYYTNKEISFTSISENNYFNNIYIKPIKLILPTITISNQNVIYNYANKIFYGIEGDIIHKINIELNDDYTGITDDIIIKCINNNIIYTIPDFINREYILYEYSPYINDISFVFLSNIDNSNNDLISIDFSNNTIDNYVYKYENVFNYKNINIKYINIPNIINERFEVGNDNTHIKLIFDLSGTIINKNDYNDNSGNIIFKIIKKNIIDNLEIIYYLNINSGYVSIKHNDNNSTIEIKDTNVRIYNTYEYKIQIIYEWEIYKYLSNISNISKKNIYML